MQRALATAAATFAVAIAAGIVAVAVNGWFGSGDLVPFGIYSVPFALLAAPAVAFVYRVTKRLPVWLASACAFILGLLFGWLSTLVVAIFLGAWFGAMSVPVLQAWCITGAFVFSAAILLRRTPLSRGVNLALVGLASVSIFAAIGFRPTLSLATGNQHLTVYFFRYHPGDTELDVSDATVALNTADINILRRTGLRGKLESRGSFSSNSTNWPRAKALLIFTSPIAEDSSLPQPKHCTIAYVQDKGGFRRVPTDAPTFARQMRIEHGLNGSQFVVEHSSGAQSGGHIEP